MHEKDQLMAGLSSGILCARVERIMVSNAKDGFMDANKNREKLLPLADLRELVRDQFAIDLTTIDVDEIIRDIPLGGSLRAESTTSHTRSYLNVHSTDSSMVD